MTNPNAMYTELGPNGEILYQSERIPADVTSAFTKQPGKQDSMGSTCAQKTSDQYKTFDLPGRFDNPGWWDGYSKKAVNPLYTTTSMDYGAEKPNIHTMPTVYRTQSSQFTEHLGKCGNFRYQGLNTSIDKAKCNDRC